MHLAWFTPWPPQPSGIAGRSAELVPALAARGHGIDVFVDERDVAVEAPLRGEPPAEGSIRIQSAHEFVWRIAREQYDLVVYQVGNSRLHEFMWPYLFRWPGLAVLHDAHLHHARGRALLSARAAAAYRAEFAWNHPDVSPDAAELGVAGFDGPYYYLWPMVRRVVSRSRTVAVHSRGGAADLQEAFPDRPIEYLPLSSGRAEAPSDRERQETRRDFGWGSEVVFGVFGALTAEKRVPQVLRAFRTTLARDPRTRLVLAGKADPALGWSDMVRSLDIEHAVLFMDSLDDKQFDRVIGAVDVTLNVRWPTAVETSGPWLQGLAAGRPTVVVDLPHQSHVPALDPRTWKPWQPNDSREPVTIAIDILDEDHSLGLALRRLATDAALRERLGRAARSYWEGEHSLDRMVSSYLSLLDRARAHGAPDAGEPPALMARPIENVRALLSEFGPLPCELF